MPPPPFTVLPFFSLSLPTPDLTSLLPSLPLELEGMTVGQMLSHDLDEVVCQFESRSSTNAVEDNLYAALVQVGTLSRTGKGLVANTYSAVGRCGPRD